MNMQLKEIRAIIETILNDIKKSQNSLTYRRYNTFFGELGMLQRRKFDVLEKFDKQLKKHHLSLWLGKSPIKKLEDFQKGETITFRLSNAAESAMPNMPKVENKNAGEITVMQKESGITLYKHQRDAIEQLQEKIIRNNKIPFAGLLVLPTGGGKTLTAAYWIAKNILDKNKKVLWIAHRYELLEQALATFKKLACKDIFTVKQSVNYRILSGIHDKPVHVKPADDIIVASKDSVNAGFDILYKNWIKNNTDELFLVIDEAHHATARTYRKLIFGLKEKVPIFRMLGLTATPFRTNEDEKGLLKKVFPDDIIYKADLRTAIRLGILSEPYFEEQKTGQNIIEQYGLSEKQIADLNSKFGDFDSILGKVANDIANNKERNYSIVKHYVQNKEKYRRTLVFAINKTNAIALNILFKEAGINSDYVISAIKDMATGVTVSSKENQIKIDKFRKGELDVLINVEILTEGTDIPEVQTVFLTRPTNSVILMTQMIGRGLRGEKAGGTKQAYIVSFVDDWQQKISWANPQKLFLEENIDFNDKDRDTTKRLLQLVAINKVEEFAILNDQIIDFKTKEELEKLSFTERVPVGIYQVRYLQKGRDDEEEEVNSEVLVYDNLRQPYANFIKDLPLIFSNSNDKDFLPEEKLEHYAKEVEQKYFAEMPQYPAYNLQDIKNMLQYYAAQGECPPFVELKDREKYDVDKIAKDFIDKGLNDIEQNELLNKIWNSEEVAWQTFFNFDKKNLLREVRLAKEKILNPELYPTVALIDKKEERALEKLPLYEIEQYAPEYARELKNTVYSRFTDKDGFYFSAQSGYKSKNKLDFQIDHIKPLSKGGLTVAENLQLLTRSENAKKSNKADE